MKLDEYDESVFDEIVKIAFISPISFDALTSTQQDVLSRAEVGSMFQSSDFAEVEVGFPGSLRLAQGDEISPSDENDKPVDVVFRENARSALSLINSFRELSGAVLYVLISRSWRCYHNCNGQIMSNVCEENHEDTTNCCASLSKQCSG